MWRSFSNHLRRMSRAPRRAARDVTALIQGIKPALGLGIGCAARIAPLFSRRAVQRARCDLAVVRYDRKLLKEEEGAVFDLKDGANLIDLVDSKWLVLISAFC